MAGENVEGVGPRGRGTRGLLREGRKSGTVFSPRKLLLAVPDKASRTSFISTVEATWDPPGSHSGRCARLGEHGRENLSAVRMRTCHRGKAEFDSGGGDESSQRECFAAVDFDSGSDGSSGVCVGPEKDEFAAQGAVGAAYKRAFTQFNAVTHVNAESYDDHESRGDHRAYHDRKYGRSHGDHRPYDDDRPHSDHGAHGHYRSHGNNGPHRNNRAYGYDDPRDDDNAYSHYWPYDDGQPHSSGKNGFTQRRRAGEHSAERADSLGGS
jgi:hypothetical protein